MTEKFAYEKRVKENKLKVAMMQVTIRMHYLEVQVSNYVSLCILYPCVILLDSQAKRSNAEIVQQIEKNEVQKHIEDRKRKRSDEQGGGDSGAAAEAVKSSTKSADSKAGEKLQRNFRQQHVIGTEYGEQLFKARPKLLNKVFAATKD